MKIGLWTPAYRYQVTPQNRDTFVQDVVWALSNGHEPSWWWSAGVDIPVQRNAAVKRAIELGCERLLMQDADCAAPAGESALERLMGVMDHQVAAAAALAFTCKDPDQPGGVVVNAEPALPGEVYLGEVGTGIMLLDIARLARIEPPWFVNVPDADGASRVCGNDVYLCRLLQEHGMRVAVDYRLPAGVHVRPFVQRLE